MTRRLIIRKGAEDDIRDAYRWYNNQRPGLGSEFVREVRSLLPVIREQPEIYAAVEPPFRRALLERFPYAIFFKADEERVEVIACFHQRREPEPWMYGRH